MSMFYYKQRSILMSLYRTGQSCNRSDLVDKVEPAGSYRSGKTFRPVTTLEQVFFHSFKKYFSLILRHIYFIFYLKRQLNNLT